jgi:hypothetical protein
LADCCGNDEGEKFILTYSTCLVGFDHEKEIRMKLDRFTARALVDAHLMSLEDYIARFGTADEVESGQTDALEVNRGRQVSPLDGERSYGHPRRTSYGAGGHFYCH